MEFSIKITTHDLALQFFFTLVLLSLHPSVNWIVLVSVYGKKCVEKNVWKRKKHNDEDVDEDGEMNKSGEDNK